MEIILSIQTLLQSMKTELKKVTYEMRVATFKFLACKMFREFEPVLFFIHLKV